MHIYRRPRTRVSARGNLFWVFGLAAQSPRACNPRWSSDIIYGLRVSLLSAPRYCFLNASQHELQCTHASPQRTYAPHIPTLTLSAGLGAEADSETRLTRLGGPHVARRRGIWIARWCIYIWLSGTSIAPRKRHWLWRWQSRSRRARAPKPPTELGRGGEVESKRRDATKGEETRYTL